MPRDRQGRRIVDCEDKEVIGWLNSWSVDRSGAWVKEEVIIEVNREFELRSE